jgi:hypothetical protein
MKNERNVWGRKSNYEKYIFFSYLVVNGKTIKEIQG